MLIYPQALSLFVRLMPHLFSPLVLMALKLIKKTKKKKKTFGKIIAGGPVVAYGVGREIMEMVALAGPIYHAGSLSGNPLAIPVGIHTLK